MQIFSCSKVSYANGVFWTSPYYQEAAYTVESRVIILCALGKIQRGYLSHRRRFSFDVLIAANSRCHRLTKKQLNDVLFVSPAFFKFLIRMAS